MKQVKFLVLLGIVLFWLGTFAWAQPNESNSFNQSLQWDAPTTGGYFDYYKIYATYAGSTWVAWQSEIGQLATQADFVVPRHHEGSWTFCVVAGQSHDGDEGPCESTAVLTITINIPAPGPCSNLRRIIGR